MKKSTPAVLLALFLLRASAGRAVGREVIVTTSLLRAVVEELSGGEIAARSLISSGLCPGHYDVKPADLLALEKSGFLLAHGYEPFLERIRQVIHDPGFKIYLLPAEKNWLILDGQIEIFREVAGILGERFPDKKGFVQEKLLTRTQSLPQLDRQIRQELKAAGLSGRKVLCQEHLKDLVESLGLVPVGTYGRKEDLTPGRIAALLEKGRAEHVALVVDNYQAGPDTGKVFATGLLVPRVVLTNFPQAFPGTETLSSTLKENVHRLIQAYGHRP